MKTGIIIQARAGSSRLPQKMLLPFDGGHSLLTTLLKRLSAAEIAPLVVATGTVAGNDLIEKTAHDHGIPCFRGSELDVRRRFIDCAVAFGMTKIIRICADNPFLDIDSLRQLYDMRRNDEDSDYIGFKVGAQPSILTHFGFWSEAFTLSALLRAEKEAPDEIYREHVTNSFYTLSQGVFSLRWIQVDDDFVGRHDIRLTVDDIHDFERTKAIYSAMQAAGQVITAKNVVAYLERKPELRAAMTTAIAVHLK